MKSNRILVVSLGFGSEEMLTGLARKTLENASSIVFRTDHHPIADKYKHNQIQFISMDNYYNRFEDFDEMHRTMAYDLWEMAKNIEIVFAVIDATNDACVRELALIKPQEGELKIIPGISAVDHFSSVYPYMDMMNGIFISPATSVIDSEYDPNSSLLITEVDSELLAFDLKLWLMDHYSEIHPVIFMSSGLHGESKPIFINPEELDRQKYYDHTVAVYCPKIPLLERDHYSLQDLNSIMDKLRSPGGCPWDRKQTHASLKQYLIEEAWETAGAIDEADDEHLAEEMGDLLFQIAFHASIGKTYEEYSMQDVIDHICKKMISRHSHVFGNDHCTSPDEVSAVWEKQKNKERGTATVGEGMKCISESFPSLTYASKAIKAVSQIKGWEECSDAILEKLEDVSSKEAVALLHIVKCCRDKQMDPEVILHECVLRLIDIIQTYEKQWLQNGHEKSDIGTLDLRNLC